jgi:Plasmid pRiA4b ORF-3-like protein/IS66 Orf2 like protein
MIVPPSGVRVWLATGATDMRRGMNSLALQVQESLHRDPRAKSLKYLYDFGDGWEHSVRIERITDAVPGIVYPRLIDAAGRCPPEDVGGPWGYREFLVAIADPSHQEHAEMLQWIGRHFDPNDVDAEALTQAVHSLAKKSTRRPSARKRG